ncbi:hypothetical protein SSBR45G_24280 [Bradyrhizobium sp. SSBR45G]|nr:hypothetical protein SSBR45G_24280 [Bradyrhizobium sp. SSBR45G]GLH84374.1 hypothetical protein SSBR45R_18340 [Bradyrhizobium sp. SSBR45R]
MLPARQDPDLYGFVTSRILRKPNAVGHSERLRYVWRNGNPIVWAANAKIGERVAPLLRNGASRRVGAERPGPHRPRGDERVCPLRTREPPAGLAATRIRGAGKVQLMRLLCRQDQPLHAINGD